MAKHYRLLNVIPSLAVSLFAPILIVPLLPTNIMLSIMNNSYWLKLIRYQSSIVGFGSLVAIVFFWLLVYNKRKGSKKHSK